MLTARPTGTPWPALRESLTGRLSLPGDPDWDECRRAWNLAVDQHPAAVVMAGSAEDVPAVIGFARDHGMRVAPQGTGHGASAMAPLDDAILLRTTDMRGVTIDPAARIARAEAGAIWDDVTSAAAPHGLAALAGSSHDVGVVGYTLGGGVSWLARKHGLATNRVTAIEVVTADGVARRVDAGTEPDLFWAMRGGGGSFGVVTALEFALLPLTELYGGAMFWPWERSGEVLHAWREWTAGVPEEVTSVAKILQLPPLPQLPPFLRGRALVVVEVAFLGDEAAGAELVAPLRALDPEIDTVATMPAPALAQLHMDPPEPVPGLGDHLLLDALPAEAVDALVAVGGPGSDSPLVSLEVRHLGGALRRAPEGGGALSSIEADYLVFGVGIPMGPGAADAIEAHLPAMRAALEPWEAGCGYLNFAERAIAVDRLFSPAAYARLQEVKRRYDPEAVFRANHQVSVGS